MYKQIFPGVDKNYLLLITCFVLFLKSTCVELLFYLFVLLMCRTKQIEQINHRLRMIHYIQFTN